MVNRNQSTTPYAELSPDWRPTSPVPLYLAAPIGRFHVNWFAEVPSPRDLSVGRVSSTSGSYRRHRSVGPDHQRPAVRLPTFGFGSCTRSLTDETDSQRADGGRRAWQDGVLTGGAARPGPGSVPGDARAVPGYRGSPGSALMSRPAGSSN